MSPAGEEREMIESPLVVPAMEPMPLEILTMSLRSLAATCSTKRSAMRAGATVLTFSSSTQVS